MLTIEKKTRSLGRAYLPVDKLDPNPMNPNKMGAREFDLLVENVQETGLTDPILVRPLEGGRYRIVGGHHRWEAAKFLGFDEIPVTIITDPNFDEEAEEMQLLRHNTIKGRLDPQKFIDLYHKYAGKYGDDVLQEMMGFADEAEFQKLIKQTAMSLPKDMQKKFQDAAKEIKTVDGLAKLLNTMFTKFGDTLPYGYMVLDYGGQQSVWLRISKKTWDSLDVIGTLCIERGRTMDDVVGGVVQSIARGDLEAHVEALLEKAPAVTLPNHLQVAPTKDNIEKVDSL